MSHAHQWSNDEIVSRLFDAGSRSVRIPNAAKDVLFNLQADSKTIPKIKKSAQDRTLLYKALNSNLLLSRLSEQQINLIIGAMRPRKVPKHCCLFRKGEVADHFFVLKSGALRVESDDRMLFNAKDAYIPRQSKRVASKGIFRRLPKRPLLLKSKVDHRRPSKDYDDVGETREMRTILSRAPLFVPGRCFGVYEMAVFSDRDYTVRCQDEVGVVFSLDLKTFLKIRSIDEGEREKRKETLIKSLECFSKIPEKNLSGLISRAELLKYTQGQQIITKGSSHANIYYIVSGEVEITKYGPDQVLSKEILLTTGDWIGEECIVSFSGKERIFDATSQGECEVLAFPGTLMDIVGKTEFKSLFKYFNDVFNMKFISTLPLFEEFSKTELGEILKESLVERIHGKKEGNIVLEQDGLPKFLFLIRAGRVRRISSVEIKGQRSETKAIREERAESVASDATDDFGFLKQENADSNHTDVYVTLKSLRIGNFFGEESFANLKSKVSFSCFHDSEMLKIPISNLMKFKSKTESRINWKLLDNRIALEGKRSFVASKLIRLTMDDFETICKIGAGAFGRVDMVRNKGLKTICALKVVSRVGAESQKQVKNLQREKQLLEKFDFHMIMRFYTTFRDDHHVYFLTECLLGGEFYSLLHGLLGEYDSMNEQSIKFYAACILEVLGYLHGKGILYRDLKPENLMLDHQGYLKVIDFGLSKEIQDGKTKTKAGTPEYCAPEMLKARPYDYMLDFWCLGVIIYEMRHHHTPFVDPRGNQWSYNKILNESPSFEKGTGDDFKNIVGSLLKKNPSQRLGQNSRTSVIPVRNHPWFSDFDFAKLNFRHLKAPWVPHLKGTDDDQYFQPPQADPTVLSPKFMDKALSKVSLRKRGNFNQDWSKVFEEMGTTRVSSMPMSFTFKELSL